MHALVAGHVDGIGRTRKQHGDDAWPSLECEVDFLSLKLPSSVRADAREDGTRPGNSLWACACVQVTKEKIVLIQPTREPLAFDPPPPFPHRLLVRGLVAQERVQLGVGLGLHDMG
jgi:hypothetical protein